MTNLPPHLQPYEKQWDEHWAMRAARKKPTTAQTKKRAANSLLRLSKEGYDIGLLLDRSTDGGWRTFWRHPECIKSRPLLETVTLDMLHRSDSGRAGEVLERVKVKRIPLRKPTSKLEMFQRLEKHLRKQL